jgi:hypothetical protein
MQKFYLFLFYLFLKEINIRLTSSKSKIGLHNLPDHAMVD